jgi:hypothetical protein
LQYIINGELFDLDTYEPQFFFPRDAWMGSKYQVNLTITDPNVKEIFYFCHIHNKMSGIPWDGGARIPIPVCHHGS